MRSTLVRGTLAVLAACSLALLAAGCGDGPICQSEALVREPLRQISRIWGKLNVLSPVPDGLSLPLLLLGG